MPYMNAGGGGKSPFQLNKAICLTGLCNSDTVICFLQFHPEDCVSTDSSHFVLGTFASGYRGDTQSVLPHGNAFYSLLVDLMKSILHILLPFP